MLHFCSGLELLYHPMLFRTHCAKSDVSPRLLTNIPVQTANKKSRQRVHVRNIYGSSCELVGQAQKKQQQHCYHHAVATRQTKTLAKADALDSPMLGAPPLAVCLISAHALLLVLMVFVGATSTTLLHVQPRISSCGHTDTKVTSCRFFLVMVNPVSMA